LSFIQWVLLVYDLAVIGLVLTLGRIGDLFGRKWIYILGNARREQELASSARRSGGHRSCK